MITKQSLDFTMQTLKNLRWDLDGLTMCELGNQHINVDGIPYKIAKDYFKSRGIIHTSIDRNGNDGAKIYDLSQPILRCTHPIPTFDIVTDFGTIEHVDNQYHAFWNMHKLCRQGGLMIHALPLVLHWKHHCEYYYNLQFFEKLAWHNNYTIISMKVMPDAGDWTGTIYIAMIKMRDNDFYKIPRDSLHYVPLPPHIKLYRFFNEPYQNFLYKVRGN
jgi:hypothetical protein